MEDNVKYNNREKLLSFIRRCIEKKNLNIHIAPVTTDNLPIAGTKIKYYCGRKDILVGSRWIDPPDQITDTHRSICDSCGENFVVDGRPENHMKVIA